MLGKIYYAICAATFVATLSFSSPVEAQTDVLLQPQVLPPSGSFPAPGQTWRPFYMPGDNITLFKLNAFSQTNSCRLFYHKNRDLVEQYQAKARLLNAPTLSKESRNQIENDLANLEERAVRNYAYPRTFPCPLSG
jgi:hypothetical protein